MKTIIHCREIFNKIRFSLYSFILCAFITSMLISCENLFNPSGDGSSQDLDAQGLISYGESLLRQNRPADAELVFRKALEKDSTQSLAYFGLGKAVLRKNNVNPTTMMDLMSQIDLAQKDSSANQTQLLTVIKSFLDKHPNLTLAIDELSKTLAPFVKRDSINQGWIIYNKVNLNQVSISQLNVEQLKRYNDFKAVFVDPTSSSYNPTYKLSQFPLLDTIIPAARVQPEYQIGNFIGMMDNFLKVATILNFSNPDSLLTAFQNGTVDFSNIDSAKASDLNASLNDLGNDASKLSSFTSSLFNSTNKDSTVKDSTKPSDEEIQQKIQSLGNTTVFYRFGDKKDNDGDGAVDEEILDSVDNDGDGLVDEDVRLTPIDFFDNNQNSKTDESSELVDPTSKLLLPSFGYVKGTYILYTDSIKDLTDIQIKDRKTLADSVRLSVVADSVLPYKITITQRCTLLGGCWCSKK